MATPTDSESYSHFIFGTIFCRFSWDGDFNGVLSWSPTMRIIINQPSQEMVLRYHRQSILPGWTCPLAIGGVPLSFMDPPDLLHSNRPVCFCSFITNGTCMLCKKYVDDTVTKYCAFIFIPINAFSLLLFFN